ncbi:MAG TPA: hypothetical protein GXZ90_08405 [Clostridiales bacterium]|nr:hypothetical protein [Clostridiales bacterium]
MFELYFGKFLLEKNKISQEQYDFIITELQNTHVKLGLIAVAENLLTKNQADTINQLQKVSDKRFGDIAIEKGFLLQEEVNHLLNLQQNSYSKMLQVIIDNNILTMEEIKLASNDFQLISDYSDREFEHLKSGEIDRIFSVFSNIDNNYINDLASLMVRNVIRFINTNITLDKSYKTNCYEFKNMASQTLVGDIDIFIGIAGNDNNLTVIAEPYAGESFNVVDEDVFDAIGEFINCSSGLFASKLSIENISLDMTPPISYINKKIVSAEGIYVVPVTINNNTIDLVLTIDSNFDIN